jgi:hypothetical protein
VRECACIFPLKERSLKASRDKRKLSPEKKLRFKTRDTDATKKKRDIDIRNHENVKSWYFFLLKNTVIPINTNEIYMYIIKLEVNPYNKLNGKHVKHIKMIPQKNAVLVERNLLLKGRNVA